VVGWTHYQGKKREPMLERGIGLFIPPFGSWFAMIAIPKENTSTFDLPRAVIFLRNVQRCDAQETGPPERGSLRKRKTT